MTRKYPFAAIVACLLAFSTITVVRADDNSERATTSPEKAEAVVPAKANSAAPGTIAVWPATDAPVRRHKKVDGVPNFGKLNDHIWRSGQPSKAGYENLKELGLKTVVNLRLETPGDKELVPEGVNYFYIPIRDERAPTEEQAQQFLDIASNPANWPLVVHCHGGEGRAGVMAALVRFAIDGWDPKKIEKETGNFRVAHLGFIKTKMCAPQREFLAKWAKVHTAGEYSFKFAKSTVAAADGK